MQTDLEILQELASRSSAFDLPLGAYMVTKNGKLVRGNRRFREMLGLLPDGEFRGSIWDQYVDPEERKRLQIFTEGLPDGQFLENQRVLFRSAGREFWVEDTSRAIRRPETREVIGYLGYLVDVDEEVRQKQLFDQLPVGIYRLDADGIIRRANRTLAKILGYDTEFQLIGRQVRDLYVYPESELAITQKVREQGSVANETIELLKQTGERIHVQVSTIAVFDTNRRFAGREGVAWDVTTEATYRQILDDMPVGTYVVETVTGAETIKSCNDAFARILGARTAGELLGKDIRDFYQFPWEHEEFLKRMQEAQASGRPLMGFSLKAKRLDGESIITEVNTRFLLDKSNRVVGRVGVVRDISGEIALWDLRDDIGRTLHQYTATLMMIQQSLPPVLRILGRSVFINEEDQPIVRATAKLKQHAASLRKELQKLLHQIEVRDMGSGFMTDLQVQSLRSELLNLTDYDVIIPHRILQIPVLRDSAATILSICDRAQESELTGEALKAVLKAARDLESLCCWILLTNVEDRILEMDYQVRSLREYVTFHSRESEQPETLRVSKIVQQAMVNHVEFARVRDVGLRYQDDSRRCKVKGIGRHLARAISNLLHNAIKYSWSKYPDKYQEEATVRIRSHVVGKEVWIEICNFGVPIRKEEIDRELIFQMGYRGVEAGDRGRLGTGVGCADSRRVVREHGGDVVITSDSATNRRVGVEDYTVPYITTAIVKLPVFEQGGF